MNRTRILAGLADWPSLRSVSWVLVLVLWACPSDGDDPSPTGPDRVPRSVTVSPGTLEFTALGERRDVAAIVRNQAGDNITSDVTVTWESDDPLIVSVDQAGQATAEGVGETEIVARAGGLTGSIPVTVEQVPARLVATESAFTGVVGQQLTDPLEVTLVDANDHPIPEVQVVFSTTDGSVSPASGLTETDGKVQSAWTLDVVATIGDERQTALAEVSGQAQVSAEFTSVALADAAVALEKVLGDGYAWIEGEENGAQMVVRVVDQHGNGVPERDVVFSPHNGGQADPATAATDPAGSAVTQWFMGNFDSDPFTPEARPDTLDVTSDGLAPVEFVGTVHPRSTAQVFTSFKPELSTHHMTTSTLHSCPDSNIVMVYPDNPPGTAGMRARILAVAGGADCTNPRLRGAPDPSYPPEKQIAYEIPFFGLRENTTWKFELTIRTAHFGLRVGNNSICPATGCFDPHAVITFSPPTVPPNDDFNTVVTLDGSESYHPEGEPISYAWTVPTGTMLLDGATLSDAVIQVRFPSASGYSVTLEVDDGFRADTTQVTVPVG